MTKKLVILESPYAGDLLTKAKDIMYAHACLRDSLERGEAPIASHLLYTQVLDDNKPDERYLGCSAGLAWARVADGAVFYVDRGWSTGMKAARAIYAEKEIPYEIRTLPEWDEGSNGGST